MGWKVMMTRKEHWADLDGPEISRGEWLALMHNDREFRPVPDAAPGTCQWMPGAAGLPKFGNIVYWEDGNVMALRPADALVGKLVRIAPALGAEVQDENGLGSYDAAGRWTGPRAPKVPPRTPRTAAPWWRVWG
ncbi:MAG: hypothetical protein ACK4GO_07410 [Gemmobacter sp.]